MSDLRIAIVGFGKIARDQHVPAIAATPGAKLVAVASRNASLPGVPHFRSLADLLRDGPEIDAVALCMPPQVRRQEAATALAARKHVMLEKPPGASVSEIAPLVAAARQGGRHPVRDLAFALCAGSRAGAATARDPQDRTGHHHLEGRRAGLASRAGLDF